MNGTQEGRSASAARARASGNRLLVTAANAMSVYYATILATIPLADANSYVVTLPPLALWPNQWICMICKRATGSYVDGTVKIQDADDNGVANFISDAATATGDFVLVYNHDGQAAFIMKELTT